MTLNAPAARAEAQAPAPFTLPPLPFASDALEPYISAQVLELHHGKHHAAYVANLNAVLAGYPDLRQKPVEELIAWPDLLPEPARTPIRNHGGGHANHSFYWNCLARPEGQRPSDELAGAIDKRFGGFEAFQERLGKAALGVFGSGWGWLCLDGSGQLLIETTPNQETPLARGHVPLLTIDVWEHAYYLQYQNRRADYIAAVFEVIDWEFVDARWREGMA